MKPVCLRCETASVDELSGHPTQPAVIEGVVVRANESHPAPWSDDALDAAANGLRGSSVFGGEQLSARNVAGEVTEASVTDGELRYRAEVLPSLARPVRQGEAAVFVRGRATVEAERDGSGRYVEDVALGRVVVGESSDAALSAHRPASRPSTSTPEGKTGFGTTASLADAEGALTDEERTVLQQQRRLRDKF